MTTGNGIEFKVSPEDVEFVDGYNWTAYKITVRGSKTYTYVGRRSAPGQKAPKKMLHRWILERMYGERAVKGMICDHINGDTLDNRRENLRLATYGINRLNSGPNAGSKSGCRGVHWNSNRQQWVVRLRIGKKDKFFGYYSDLEEAKRMAKDANLVYTGMNPLGNEAPNG